MSTTSDQLCEQAMEVTKDLQETDEIVRDAAQEGVRQVAQTASQCCEEEREKIHGVACACEQFLRERPLRSVLMAVGVGWLFGKFWKRR